MKINIGNSDYSKEQMLSSEILGIGCPVEHFLYIIQQYENDGYTVKFETSLFRKIFGITKYKVVAYRELPNKNNF